MGREEKEKPTTASLYSNLTFQRSGEGGREGESGDFGPWVGEKKEKKSKILLSREEIFSAHRVTFSTSAGVKKEDQKNFEKSMSGLGTGEREEKGRKGGKR